MTDLTDEYPNAYYCDNWVVVQFKGADPHYRVLTGTSGGYTQGSSWRMNSGIVKVEEDAKYYAFLGSSGSAYLCRKGSYGLRMNNAHIWTQLQMKREDDVVLMDEATDWMNMDWIIK